MVGACLLAACASSYAPGAVVPGMDQATVVQRLGPPTGRHAGDGGGSRLEFARGPMGLHTYMVDLDAQGRVTGWQQVLTEANFNAITPGMTTDELLRRLGRPGAISGGARLYDQYWTWRFDDWQCRWWHAGITGGRVVATSYGPDPRCQYPNDAPRTPV